MDKDKFLKEMKKFFSDKKMSNILIVLLVLAFVLLAINILAPDLIKANNKNNDGESKITEENKESVNSKNQYEENQKRELIDILQKIQGVGKVHVMISFESGEVKIPAYDTNTQTTTTEETDKNGGKRTNNQTNEGSTVVMTTEGGENSPLIVQTYKPKVIGVVVTAEGASGSRVKYDIEKAVANLYDLPADRVNVYPMEK